MYHAPTVVALAVLIVIILLFRSCGGSSDPDLSSSDASTSGEATEDGTGDGAIDFELRL